MTTVVRSPINLAVLRTQWTEFHRVITADRFAVESQVDPEVAYDLAKRNYVQMNHYLTQFTAQNPEPYLSLCIRRALAIHVIPFLNVDQNTQEYADFIHAYPLPNNALEYCIPWDQDPSQFAFTKEHLIPRRGWRGITPPAVRVSPGYQRDHRVALLVKLQEVLAARAMTCGLEIELYKLMEQDTTVLEGTPRGLVDQSQLDLLRYFWGEFFHQRDFAFREIATNPTRKFHLLYQVYGIFPDRILASNPVLRAYFEEKGLSDPRSLIL